MNAAISRFLAIGLVLALPAAPALCQGSGPEAEADVLPCHAHVQQAETAGMGAPAAPDQESKCCSACDSYVAAKALTEAPALGAGFGSQVVPEFPSPIPYAGNSFHAHPPPWHAFSPFVRSSAPLRL